MADIDLLKDSVPLEDSIPTGKAVRYSYESGQWSIDWSQRKLLKVPAGYTWVVSDVSGEEIKIAKELVVHWYTDMSKS